MDEILIDMVVIANGLGSLQFIIAYLAFLFAAVGLANSSRHRWEDLAFRKYEEETVTPLIKAAKEQAKRDFHDWYISIILISTFAAVLIIVSLYLINLSSRFLLGLSLITVLCGLIYCLSTYMTEKREFKLDP